MIMILDKKCYVSPIGPRYNHCVIKSVNVALLMAQLLVFSRKAWQGPLVSA